MAKDKEAERVQAEARTRFPAGTKYISYGSPAEVKGKLTALRAWENRLVVTDGYGTVYIAGIWAEKIDIQPEAQRKGNQFLLF